ncbi:CASP-like protein 4A3 [Humulus lupulus]|uniref:CASP-like protein 4A3 n=1 Tax=Humulus lupulus TaxID=3486 RepID=UPI002B4171FD|nr:CASP-like protein 4A3 [Humulus lupulus]
MESQTQTNPNHNHSQQTKRAMKKSSSRNSDTSQLDSPHSPLRFHSPLRSDAGDPPESPPYESPDNSPEKPQDNSKAIVPVEKVNHYQDNHHSLRQSTTADNRQQVASHQLKKQQPNATVQPTTVINRATREEAPQSVAKVGPVAGASGGENGSGGGGRRSTGRRSTKEDMLKSAALGFRVSEVILCLISFSVMAADKTQGWSGDSFDRYKEYRYCLSVNVIAFAYALFQTYDLSYHLSTGKHVIRHHLRRHFEFFMDQILAYLLISASSSAATRVDDWQSNWGKDEFTEMASASVGMAFLAFGAFAISSIISGYNLWTD